MKKIFRMAIVCALAGAALLTGCTKDYGTDIANLQKQLDGMENTLSQLQNAINAGSVITSVTQTSEGIVVKLSNGKEYLVKDGAKGDKGDKGDQGAKGDKGDKGDQGAKGDKGDKGDQGETGPQGPQGDKGDKGDQGETGPQGPQGDKGDKGDKGDDGAAGADGKSAYELVVEKGYTGTLDEWLESLKGEQGAQGEQGEQGEKGDTGLSAYELAVENGYTGTIEEWIADLQGEKGEQGEPGKSAYELALEAGITDAETMEEWVKSLYPVVTIELNEEGIPYWCINGEMTEYTAKGDKGDKGDAPYIGENGNWWIGEGEEAVDLGVKAQGPKGDKGDSPYIGENGNWWIGEGEEAVDLGVQAQGPKGDKGDPGNFWTYDVDNFQWVEHEMVLGEDGEYTDTLTGEVADIFPNSYRPLTAVWTDEGISFANIACEFDEEGNATEWKSFTIDLRAVLTSIVSIPDLYYAGIEAFKYYYLYYTPGGEPEGEVLGIEDDEVQPADIFEKNAFVLDEDADEYYAGSRSIAWYFVNPERYDIDNAEWALYPDDKVYMQLQTRHEGWTPILDEITRVDGGANRARVLYHIDNADCLEPCPLDELEASTGAAETKAAVDDAICRSGVSIMHLEGVDSINENKTVSSDFAAVVPMEEAIDSLAFSKDVWSYEPDGWKKTVMPPYEPCSDNVDFQHLFGTAQAAVEHQASWFVSYEGGEVPVDFIGVHMLDADETAPRTVGDKHVLYTLDELYEKYPQFDIELEFVKMQLGNHETSEEAYGQLRSEVNEGGHTDWFFQPCEVQKTASGYVSNPIPRNPLLGTPNFVHQTYGKSSVGKKPLVLVKLVDRENDDAIVRIGYFKIYISEAYIKTETPETDTWDGMILKDFTDDEKSFAFDCIEYSDETTWVDMSSELLERMLHIKYQDFAEHYVWYEGKNYVPETYRMDPKKAFPANPGVSTWKGSPIWDNLYGTVEYRKDTGVGGINDKFIIHVNYPQKDRIINSDEGKKLWPNGVVTLYARFDKEKGYVPNGMPEGFSLPDHVYIGLTFKVDPIGDGYNFILHNQSYWFDDLGEGVNTVRRNVTVPLHWLSEDAGEEGVNDDVTDFHTPLTQDWAGNTIFLLLNKDLDMAEILADPENPHIPEEAIDLFNNDLGYYCRFSFLPEKDQPKINGQKWIVKKVDDDTTSLWWGKKGGVEGKYTDQDVVVKLDVKKGDIRYVWAKDSLYVSKYLLNLWQPYAEPYDEILYCKVRITAYQTNAPYNPDDPDSWNEEPDNEYECDIELCHEDINVRFLRPLNFNFESTGYLVDGQPGGSYIPLGGLFEAYDWNKDEFETGFKIFDKYTTKSVVDPEKDSTYFDTCYYTDRGVDIHQKEGAIVEWYGYYGFSSMSVDIANIRTDQLGEGRRDLVKIDTGEVDAITGEPIYDPKSVNPVARFWIADVADKQAAVDPDSIDLSDVNNLSKYVFVYANDNGVTKDFHFYIPVKVVYAWGVYEAILEVPVRGTKYHPTEDDNIIEE